MRKTLQVAAYVLGSVVLVAALAVPAIAARAHPALSSTMLDPLSASIIGPDEVKPNVPCLYMANVQGGTPPYTYAWSAPGGSSSDADFVYYNIGTGSSYWVTLEVTDAAAQHIQEDLRVTTDPNAMVCPY